MERERLTDFNDCDLAQRWGVTPDTMRRVWLSAQDWERETGRQVFIISGYRTAAEQRELKRRGRPTAPDSLSTHRSCPATGVDISFGYGGASGFEKAIWGRITLVNGLRWGGGGKVDQGGIPLDWQHVDRGPRN